MSSPILRNVSQVFSHFSLLYPIKSSGPFRYAMSKQVLMLDK